MGFAPDFQHDVFISHAAADRAWVSRFHKALTLRLRTWLETDSSVFCDQKPDDVDSPADDRPRTAVTIVPVFSAHYLRSTACMEELATFLSALTRLEDSARRVFPVWLESVDRSGLPARVANLMGFSFFTTASGRQDDGTDRYWLVLDDLCSEIAATLRGVVEGTAPGNAVDRAVVYLAETSDDIEIPRSELRRALTQRGVTVLPATLLPRTRGALRTAVERDLMQSSVSVHMVGPTYGDTLTDADTSIAMAQVEIAVEVARKKQLRRIVWMSSATSMPTDDRQLEFHRWIATADAPDDLLRGGLEELKAVVFDSLPRRVSSIASPSPTVSPPAAPEGEVFISYSTRDASEFALQLSHELSNRGLRVWIDQRHIRPGVVFRRAIETALKRSTHLVIVLSPEAVESDEVMGEVNKAIAGKKPVFPVLYLPCDIPSYLYVRQHVDFRGVEGNDQDRVSALVRALRGDAVEAG